MRVPIFIFFICLGRFGWSQIPDTLSSRNNIVKLNLSSHILYRTSFILNYERVLNPRQTLGITAGYLEFPDILTNDSLLSVRNNISKNGYMFAAEYRFYLSKENKFKAPHGIYIGPYFSFYHFNNQRQLTFINDLVQSNAVFESKIQVLNLGFQLGYQFVVNDRWALDFVFAGPSLSAYSGNFKLDNDIGIDNENELIKALLEKFPFMNELIDESGLNFHNTNLKWGLGYRYLFQVGYKFGTGKKSK